MFSLLHSLLITDKLQAVEETRASKSGTQLASASSPLSRTPTLTGFPQLSSTRRPRLPSLWAPHGIEPSRFGTTRLWHWSIPLLVTRLRSTLLIWHQRHLTWLQVARMDRLLSGTSLKASSSVRLKLTAPSTAFFSPLRSIGSFLEPSTESKCGIYPQRSSLQTSKHLLLTPTWRSAPPQLVAPVLHGTRAETYCSLVSPTTTSVSTRSLSPLEFDSFEKISIFIL